MTRTTPPRRLDIATHIPELVPLARSAVRLHPRRGEPTVHDSSIGGPLLWPADEPWPACPGPHATDFLPVTIAQIRLQRALREARDRMDPESPEAEEFRRRTKQALQEIRTGHPPHSEPNAMLPVLQLHLRDLPAPGIPGFTAPAGTDLLQVLWCPMHHDPEWMPAIRMVWRSSDGVDTVLTDPPLPADVEYFGGYVPEPCVLFPETVTEYPGKLELPKDLTRRITAFRREFKAAGGGNPGNYSVDLSTAPGSKLGGWATWSFRDPSTFSCTDCGTDLQPFLNLASTECYEKQGGSWTPVEDRRTPSSEFDRVLSHPTQLSLGDNWDLQVYACPVSFDHPHRELAM